MKVLHVITGLEVGGAQSLLCGLLAAWRREGGRHAVVSLTSNGRVAREIEALGVPVYPLGMRPGRFDLLALRRLSHRIRVEGPDLVHTWLYHADLAGGAAARLACRAPVIWGIHHTLSAVDTLKPATKRVVRLNARLSHILPARIVCCSRLALETHAAIGYRRDRMLVIGNGVDTDRFRPDAAARGWLRNELGLPSEARLIGMFARFHPQKDHRNFLRAAGRLKRMKPDVHFVLAGDGLDDRNPLLDRWITEAGLAGAVHALGLREEMPRLYAALDVFTLSSSSGEAAPMAVCEAMACGIPCVGTDVGDMPQMIAQAGQHVPVQDPDALAQAWRSILELPAADYRRVSALARSRVEQENNLQTVATMYADLYKQVIS